MYGNNGWDADGFANVFGGQGQEYDAGMNLVGRIETAQYDLAVSQGDYRAAGNLLSQIIGLFLRNRFR